MRSHTQWRRLIPTHIAGARLRESTRAGAKLFFTCSCTLQDDPSVIRVYYCALSTSTFNQLFDIHSSLKKAYELSLVIATTNESLYISITLLREIVIIIILFRVRKILDVDISLLALSPSLSFSGFFFFFFFSEVRETCERTSRMKVIAAGAPFSVAPAARRIFESESLLVINPRRVDFFCRSPFAGGNPRDMGSAVSSARKLTPPPPLLLLPPPSSS